MSKEAVLFSHDGGLDDYLCILLLSTMENIHLLGVSITPADCYIEPATSATRKILAFTGLDSVPVAASTVRGLNPFPRALRRTSFQVDNLPILNHGRNSIAPLVKESGQEFIVKVLREADEPVTFLETGPLTTLAAALDLAPDIESKIARIVWMGGALNVRGNVSPFVDFNVDGSAEWNAYWDPIAAHQVWQTSIPIVMCPLDITNNVPLTGEFMDRLAQNYHCPYSDFAGQCYALVRSQPYYFWDVLTTAYLARPDLFTTREWQTVIIPTGPSQGRTKVEEGGRTVTALHEVKVADFYDYIIRQWAR
jgi:purine nucleosidase